MCENATEENKFNIEITEEEYKKELELMRKQYGQEEDLYPWIYMLLKSCNNTKDLSLRNVAGASKAESVLGRELYRGYAAFPDIAILENVFFVIRLEDNKIPRDVLQKIIDKKWKKDSDEYNALTEKISKVELNSNEQVKLNKNEIKYLSDYVFNENKEKLKGCVEVKKLSASLIEFPENEFVELKIECQDRVTIEPSADRPWYSWYRKVEEIKDDDDIVIKNGTDEYKEFKVKNFSTIAMKGVKELTINGNNVISQDVEWTFVKTERVTNEKNINDTLEDIAYIMLEKDKPIFTLNGNVIEHDHLVEVIGELLWYGKVLYTNGEIWKFLKVEECKISQDVKEQIISIGQLRKELYEEYVRGSNTAWYKGIAEKNLTIKISYKTFPDKENKKNMLEFLNEISWQDAASEKNM